MSSNRRQSDDADVIDVVLSDDASHAYASMSEPTRESYRAVVREIARWSGSSVEAVARAAVDIGSDHVGEVLLGNRRQLVESRMGCSVPHAKRFVRFLVRHAVVAYVGAIVASSTLLLAGLERVLSAAGPTRFVLGLFLAIPVVVLASRTADLALWTLPRPRRRFSRLAPDAVVLKENRTLVVMPVLVAGVAEVERVLANLEISHRENADPSLSWAILTDCVDASTKDMPGDAAILAAARGRIDALNERYAIGQSPRFHHFHRERRWNANAKVWMGWERKRGKLVELNAMLLGAEDTSFRSDIGDASAVRGVRYVITLDADSRLPKNAAVKLVATAAHPLNRPKFAEGTNVVVAGYSMLQPMIVGRVEEKGIWAAVHFKFDLPDDEVFRVGHFLGKGIYDVAAFKRALDNQIPENALLSHDHLEGMFAGVALLNDIHILEYEPSSVTTYARRLHRWTRGDWQLLPWLFPIVRGEDGRWQRNSLGLLQRWWIARVLMMSLVPPALVAAIAVAWSSDRVGAAWIWSASLVALMAVDMALLTPLAIVVRSVLSGARARALSRAFTVARQMLGHVLMNLVLLPFFAWVRLDAIVRVLYRLVVSRSRLLEWTTAAHAEGSGRSRTGLVATVREMRGMFVLLVTVASSISLLHPIALGAAAPLLLLWTLSPVLVSWVARQSETAEKT